MSPAVTNPNCSEGILCMNGSFQEKSWSNSSSEYNSTNITFPSDLVIPSQHPGVTSQPYDFRTNLQWLLPLHIYGFAFLFFMLAFYTFFSILNLRSQLLSTRPFMSTINLFVCILGVSRAVSFVIDPYFIQKKFPELIGCVLWDVGYPSILSAFGLIQLAFSQLTQMKLRPESLRKKSFLSLIITVHFGFVLGSNVVAVFQQDLKIIKDIVQIVFICWGLLLCITFLYGGTRIIRLLKELPNSAFNGGESGGERKGILQLALLAQCNNIASSVITAAVPSISAPKIRITDENNLTFSITSEASKQSSPMPNIASTSSQENVPQINITTIESSLNSADASPDKMTIHTFDPITEVTEEYSDENCQEGHSNKFKDKGKCEYSVGNTIELKQDINKNGTRRKKSLSWIDDPTDCINEGVPTVSQTSPGATLGSNIQGSKKRRRSSDLSSSRKYSSGSISNTRKNSSTGERSNRRGANSSIGGYRHGSFSSEAPIRKDSITLELGTRKGSHIGEAIAGSRRNSYSSDPSGRRGSRGLNTGASSSRRGSYKMAREDREDDNVKNHNSGTNDDITLSSVLHHIAYANQSANSKIHMTSKESRKEQVIQVLNISYICAIFGMLLSILLVFDPYIRNVPNSPVQSWVWFIYVSTCRLLELLVGCVMANITRQPVNRHSQYAYSLRMKPRNSLYM